MNNKILIIICFLELFLIGYLIHNNRNTYNPPDTKELVRDSIIRDSIYIINDSIKTEIRYIKETYKEDSTVIMSASDSLLFCKFSDYIENYNNK